MGFVCTFVFCLGLRQLVYSYLGQAVAFFLVCIAQAIFGTSASRHGGSIPDSWCFRVHDGMSSRLQSLFSVVWTLSPLSWGGVLGHIVPFVLLDGLCGPPWCRFVLERVVGGGGGGVGARWGVKGGNGASGEAVFKGRLGEAILISTGVIKVVCVSLLSRLV